MSDRVPGYLSLHYRGCLRRVVCKEGAYRHRIWTVRPFRMRFVLIPYVRTRIRTSSACSAAPASAPAPHAHAHPAASAPAHSHSRPSPARSPWHPRSLTLAPTSRRARENARDIRWHFRYPQDCAAEYASEHVHIAAPVPRNGNTPARTGLPQLLAGGHAVPLSSAQGCKFRRFHGFHGFCENDERKECRDGWKNLYEAWR